ncbi:MAG TPA: HAD family phosphatase, partial [Acidovorax temperans]|nr:HAD family phosphatase [Acidovorax temperans]
MKFEAILFDCDGVLVDSEPITNGVLCTMLNEAGWAISAQDCMEIFIGKTVRSEAARIQAHTGKPLTDAWMAQFYARRNAELQANLQPIAGAVDAVRAVHALLGGRIACASGADRQKVEMQLAQVGLASYFGDRVFSGHEMPRTKPAPDVYLAAAAALKVDPARCLVVEDTVTGVTAGVAAGATVVGYSPSSVGHSSP